MTAGLMGGGTEADPWLITSMAEMLVVLRDAAGTGFYRVAAELDDGGFYSLPPVTNSVASGYAPKVIDGDGYQFKIGFDVATSGPLAVFGGVHFRNIAIHVRSVARNASFLNVLYQCSVTDVAVYAERAVGSSGATTLNILSANSGMARLIPPDASRLVLFNGVAPSVAQSYFLGFSASGVNSSDCYVYTTGTPGDGLTKLTQPPTLQLLDELSGGSFSSHGWWQQDANLMPYQAATVALNLATVADSASRSRLVWLESEGYSRLIAESDQVGAAQAAVRIRKLSSFTLFASEDYGADELLPGRLISQGRRYLPPADTGYVYVAGADGRIASLDGVVFGDQPVVISGIEFTPRAAYTAVMSGRRSIQRNGASQTVVLDSSGGGGGPVIDGDRAYLDGIVEEIHPMTGARQALANCEVVAFERRGSDYVAMGSTYSDGIGGFRLETDVYGGGDVFAFAADFPGVIFQSGVPLNVGDRIRPALANGYVYEIIQPGTAGPAEPVWWPDQGGGTEGDIGTARARARPYYQPVGHGPLKMTLIE